MKTKKISKSDFHFEFAGHGHYKVTYTSPKTGKMWRYTTDDMPLIDDTKNAEYPKRKDLESLKDLVKTYGAKFNGSKPSRTIRNFDF